MSSQQVLNAVYLRLETHNQNLQYLLPFHVNNGYVNASECYVILKYLSCVTFISHTQRKGNVRSISGVADSLYEF